MPVTLGYELEVIVDRTELREHLASVGFALVQGLGFTSVHMRPGSGLKTSYDSSIGRGYEMAVEVQSGVYDDLSGAVEDFRKVVAAIAAAGGKLNKWCALHLHSALPGITQADWPLVLAFIEKCWMPLQGEFMLLGYQGGKKRNRHTDRLRFASAWTGDDILHAARCGPAGWSQLPSSRMMSFNPCALLKHGTVECRVFPATLDPEEFERWAARWLLAVSGLEEDNLPDGVTERALTLARLNDDASNDWQQFKENISKRLSRKGD